MDFYQYIMLSDEEVRHVAKLARIKLSEEEVKRFAPQLSKVLDYMDILKEVDTENTPETIQVTGLSNVMEKDGVLHAQSSREELLDCSELPVESKQIKVSRAI